jgi:hypothetical protein
MFCEAYREPLKNAAAAGSAIHGDARSHLVACEACAAAFAEEQALFAAMDSGLSKLVNADAPPSLLPRVREAIANERIFPRRTLLSWAWLPAAAVAATLLAVFLPRVFHSSHPEDVRVAAVQPPSPATGTAENPGPPQSDDPENTIPVRRITPIITMARSVAVPEVIVSPQEEAALTSYAAMLRKRADLAQALLDSSARKSTIIEPLVIAEIDSTDLRIEPLVKDSDDVTR